MRFILPRGCLFPLLGIKWLVHFLIKEKDLQTRALKVNADIFEILIFFFVQRKKLLLREIRLTVSKKRFTFHIQGIVSLCTALTFQGLLNPLLQSS